MTLTTEWRETQMGYGLKVLANRMLMDRYDQNQKVYMTEEQLSASLTATSQYFVNNTWKEEGDIPVRSSSEHV